ncbi:MAG: SRPBCC family protein [Actinomycetota bacterium]
METEIRIPTCPEIAFSFFVDPEKYPSWQGVRAELDPQPGGIYRVEMETGDVARGEYLEVDPPRRLVFTWGWEGKSEVPPGPPPSR